MKFKVGDKVRLTEKKLEEDCLDRIKYGVVYIITNIEDVVARLIRADGEIGDSTRYFKNIRLIKPQKNYQNIINYEFLKDK